MIDTFELGVAHQLSFIIYDQTVAVRKVKSYRAFISNKVIFSICPFYHNAFSLLSPPILTISSSAYQFLDCKSGCSP